MPNDANGSSRTRDEATNKAKDKDTTTALVEAAREGDEDAWSQLHVLLNPMLLGVAAGMGLRDADIADAVQSTWTRCFESFAQLREPAAVPGWLRTICRREAIRIARARARCMPMASDDLEGRTAILTAADAPSTGDPLAIVVESEAHASVHSLVAGLGQRDRTLVRALFDDDVSYRRIAELMDMPIGSIGPTRQRIVAKLRRRAHALDVAA